LCFLYTQLVPVRAKVSVFELYNMTELVAM